MKISSSRSDRGLAWHLSYRVLFDITLVGHLMFRILRIISRCFLCVMSSLLSILPLAAQLLAQLSLSEISRRWCSAAASIRVNNFLDRPSPWNAPRKVSNTSDFREGAIHSNSQLGVREEVLYYSNVFLRGMAPASFRASISPYSVQRPESDMSIPSLQNDHFSHYNRC